MKKLKLFAFLLLSTIGVFTSCSPDYEDQAGIVDNPTNPTNQNVFLNFTSGSFIGIINSTTYPYGGEYKVKKSMFFDDEPSYLLSYMLGLGNNFMPNTFNGHIFNKDNGQLSPQFSLEGSDNIVSITNNGKLYTSISGTFTLTDEQVIGNEEDGELIKCNFKFDGKFKVTDMFSGDVLEPAVNINGIVKFQN